MLNLVVSVIIPCYNQAQFLKEAVESVIAQTYDDWECLIINDGSPDNTEEVALNLVKLDDRIKYFKKNNGGISDARNFGIDKAKGEYILPLDGDDKIGKAYIEMAIKEIERDTKVKVVYCDVEFFGALQGKWNLPEFSLKELAANNMIVCTALFRKSDWERIGGYDLNMKAGWEDWEFWINMLKDGGKVVKIPYTEFFYRIKNDSRNHTIASENKFKLQNYMCKKHIDFFHQQIGNPIYLYAELSRYKNSFEYITNKLPFRIYNRIKFYLKLS